MKRLFALIGFLCAAEYLAAHGEFNSDFMRERLSKDQLSQGRSLKEILEQHGKPLEPGKIILTVDGILADESPSSEKLAKLQHRVAKLMLVRDPLLTDDILPKFKSRSNGNVLPLVAYVKKVFKGDVLSFFSVVIQEKKEIDSIQTEALHLMSDKACRAGCLDISRNLNMFQVVFIELEQMINSLWDLLVNQLPDDYASPGE